MKPFVGTGRRGRGGRPLVAPGGNGPAEVGHVEPSAGGAEGRRESEAAALRGPEERVALGGARQTVLSWQHHEV